EPHLIELERCQGFGFRQLVIECPPERLRGRSRLVHWGQTTVPRDRSRRKKHGDPGGVAVEKPGTSAYLSSPRGLRMCLAAPRCGWLSGVGAVSKTFRGGRSFEPLVHPRCPIMDSKLTLLRAKTRG